VKPYLEALLGVARRYPNWNFPPETAQAWACDLLSLPIEAVQAACVAFCRESEYPPTIAGIYKRAKILAGSGVAMTYGEAWAELMRNRVTFSQNRYESRDERRKPYTWTCEAARQAAEQVGWQQDWEGESMVNIRAHFRDIFNAIVARQNEIDWKRDAIENHEQVRRIEAQNPRLEGK